MSWLMISDIISLSTLQAWVYDNGFKFPVLVHRHELNGLIFSRTCCSIGIKELFFGNLVLKLAKNIRGGGRKFVSGTCFCSLLQTKKLFWKGQLGGAWFQIFFIFTPIWGRFPFWLIFFRWVVQPPTSGVHPKELRWCDSRITLFSWFCNNQGMESGNPGNQPTRICETLRIPAHSNRKGFSGSKISSPK